MQEANPTENSFEEFEKPQIKRRQLLPWWIKFFCWLFMLFGIMAFVCLFLGFTNINPSLSLYGFETNKPFSIIGMLIISVGILKGITAYSLWFEKDFAIKIGKIDAIIGIIITSVSMAILPFLLDEFSFTFRLELILLIPFLIKLNKIQKKWENIY